MIELKEAVKREAVCPNCHRVWKFETSDLEHLQGKGEGFYCPSCGEEVVAQANPTNGHLYPIDFYDFSKGAEMSDEKINKWVDECIEHLRASEDKNATYDIACGNTYVMGFRTADDTILIRVAKNYAEVEIE